jgi:hypothetical protein
MIWPLIRGLEAGFSDFFRETNEVFLKQGLLVDIGGISSETPNPARTAVGQLSARSRREVPRSDAHVARL